MSDYEYERTYTISINAPAHAVFEHCRDPRHMFSGHPKITVDDVTVTPEGVGTIAHVRNETMPVTEFVTHEFTEFVPDQRIVVTTHLKMLHRDLKQGVTWTWDFAPEGEGTRVTVDFHQTHVPWLQHLMEGLGEKSWTATVNDWLASLKAGAEQEAAAAK